MQDKKNRKEKLYRGLFYFVGLVVLAFGICLNKKTELGISPILSTAYATSVILKYEFADMTFALYCLLVVIEIVIHCIQKFYKKIPFDLLQIVLSLVFTRFMKLFEWMIPNFKEEMAGSFLGSIPGRIIMLIIAIVLIGIGAALSLNARLIPNPGDGVVQAISDISGKKVGFVKNCFDISCVCISTILGLVFVHTLVGIGIGTVLAMIGVGRVIALFNHFTLSKINELSGLNNI